MAFPYKPNALASCPTQLSFGTCVLQVMELVLNNILDQVDHHAHQRISPVRQNNLPFSPRSGRPDTYLVHFKHWRGAQIREWSLITGRGGGEMGGGQMKFYPCGKDGQKSFGFAIFPFYSTPPPPAPTPCN